MINLKKYTNLFLIALLFSASLLTFNSCSDDDEIADDAFSVSNIQSQYATYSALIEPYATTEIDGYTFLNNSSDFQAAVSELNAHVSQRATAVSSYLNQQ